jgi:hypothetical protein
LLESKVFGVDKSGITGKITQLFRRESSPRAGFMRIFPSIVSCRNALLVLGLFYPSFAFATAPKQATLIAEVVAPITADGKQIGSVKLPAGSEVTVVSVQGDGVMVSRGGGEPFKVAKEAMQGDVLSGFPRTDSAPAAKSPTASASPASPSPTPVARTSGDALALQARPGMLRVDLSWAPQGEGTRYEIRRAPSAQGPWSTLQNPTPEFRRFSDFIGKPGERYFYQVRAMKAGKSNAVPLVDWSEPMEATTLPYDRDKLMNDEQEAAVRFYVDEALPASGLSPEGRPGWGPTITAIGASGMGIENIIVGVERGFIPRQEGLDLILRQLRFLDTKAEKQKGAFGHWMDDGSGEIKPFMNPGTSVDLVETAFLIEGVIIAREYFKGDTPEEKELREIANRLSANVEWDKFMARAEKDPSNPKKTNWVHETNAPVMIWHWHPVDGFSDVPVKGFNEALMCYLLGIGSETHPINPQSYYEGWMDPQRGLGKAREDFGIKHSLGYGVGWPLFFAHYTFIGYDPKQVSYDGKSYFDHFVDACRIQQLYAKSRAGEFKGFDTLWGQAASLYPKGYRPNEPGPRDDGTIASTAALSSMPYLPEAVIPCMESMYLNYGDRLWGPYGFYNAINPTQNWVGQKYIGIELGPIAPMIENYRSGLFWKLFMQSPEARRAAKKIEEAKPAKQ